MCVSLVLSTRRGGSTELSVRVVVGARGRWLDYCRDSLIFFLVDVDVGLLHTLAR